MTILVQTEINVSRILREDLTAEELARVALEALDQCSHKLFIAGKSDGSKTLSDGRTQLTALMRQVFPAT